MGQVGRRAIDTSAEELRALLDREKIRDCIARLARGEDRRDLELLKACHWPDSSYDYGMSSGNFSDYLRWVLPGMEAITNTQHIIAQSVIELDGDTAKAETHVISYHRVDLGEGEHDTVVGGRYLDVLEKRAGTSGAAEWRIAHRTMVYDWYQDWGTALAPTEGIMGYPALDGKFAGRTRGDWSEVFFGKRVEE